VLSAAYFFLLLVGAGYFLFCRRAFDLFAVAFGGAAFYFSPLLLGQVPDWNGTHPFSSPLRVSEGAYAIGFLFTSAVIVGAAIIDAISTESKIYRESPSSLANWYIILALIGLIGAVISGKILDRNKAFVLTQVGYWFILFEFSAAMAWIDAFLFKRWAQLLIATALLAIDLVFGFRLMTVMCFFAYLLIEIGSRGRITLWRSIPFAAAATTVAFFALLTINNIREVSLRYFGVTHTEIIAEASDKLPIAPAEAASQAPIRTDSVVTSISDLATRVPRLIAQMEPFVTQAILSKVTKNDFRCKAPQIKNLALIVPLAGRLVGGPNSFESQFKPAFFPKFWAGMGGNAWAEIYCDFGYPGVVIEVLLVVLLIGVAQFMIIRVHSSLIPAILLSGVFLSFYFHRNDLLFELLLIRRTAMVFIIAFGCHKLLRHARLFVAPKGIRETP
jgi:hypothetical protein